MEPYVNTAPFHPYVYLDAPPAMQINEIASHIWILFLSTEKTWAATEESKVVNLITHLVQQDILYQDKLC